MKFKHHLSFFTVLLFFLGALVAKNNPRSISGGSRPAGNNALTILSESAQDYSITRTSSGDYIFYPLTGTSKTGFIFYPGGKVEAEAYLPIIKSLAQKGYVSILVHMPADLAVFNKNGASKFIKEYPEIQNWFIGGHSLGGAMAADYVAKNGGKIKGLILMAAYSTKKIKSEISVLSLYGSNDGVIALEKYEKYKSNLPSDFMEFIIEGGCHSYFGDYGMQEGDGVPEISREEQVSIVTEQIEGFIKSVIQK